MYHEIDITIMDRVLTTTPPVITPEILRLCGEIAPGQTPRYVDHIPAPDAKPQECFPNVVEHVKAHGGELVFGWAIWEWPGVFLEAEHHGVWSLDGRLIDITPHDYMTNRVLFLPDPASPYDFETGIRRINVKRPLSDVPIISEWLAAADEMHHRLEACSVGHEYRFSPADQRDLSVIGHRVEMGKRGVYFHLANSTGVNDPCFCRSGRKFKKCCSQFFR